MMVRGDGRTGPTGPTGPPATEGTSRRRVHTQVTHPARTIIVTDSADARRPVVGLERPPVPAAPTPPEPTAFINRPNSRVLRRRTVGVADGVSVATVARASGTDHRTRPARPAYPGGCPKRQQRSRQPTGEGSPAGRSYTRRRGAPDRGVQTLAPRVRYPRPESPPARMANSYGARWGAGSSEFKRSVSP